MEKTVVSLMCDNINKQLVDIDEMVIRIPEQAIHFIHGQYIEAKRELNKVLQSKEKENKEKLN